MLSKLWFVAGYMRLITDHELNSHEKVLVTCVSMLKVCLMSFVVLAIAFTLWWILPHCGLSHLCTPFPYRSTKLALGMPCTALELSTNRGSHTLANSFSGRGISCWASVVDWSVVHRPSVVLKQSIHCRRHHLHNHVFETQSYVVVGSRERVLFFLSALQFWLAVVKFRIFRPALCHNTRWHSNLAAVWSPLIKTINGLKLFTFPGKAACPCYLLAFWAGLCKAGSLKVLRFSVGIYI